VTLRVIYEPKGRAKEYADLAVNLYRGCDHACTYCYAPDVLHITPEAFVKPAPRLILNALRRDADELAQRAEQRSILLCFTCDPYQRIDTYYELTRYALEILLPRGLNVTILTKGGLRSLRDVDLWRLYPKQITYATTLVFTDEAMRQRYEPHAAPTLERIEALQRAHLLGIPTWVSLEPVFSAKQTLDLIDATHLFVDEYKVGMLNHERPPVAIDWRAFGESVTCHLLNLGKRFYIKDDLRRAMQG